MAKEIVYEWDWEEKDEFGDIIDHNHSDTIKNNTEWKTEGNEKGSFQLVLIRDVWKDEDLINRQWAYVENNNLPDKFDDGASIPIKYKKQFEQWRFQNE